jgi:hypothetical protein|tara:strand:- start:4399 stop:4647 length:249 start_codon:yes stop_codon:yes gene_type:complete
MSKYWFKPKRYGYGATPSSWEGWLITIFFILVIMSRAIKLQNNQLRFVVELVLIITVLIIVSKYKTEGGWKWRWGKTNQKRP